MTPMLGCALVLAAAVALAWLRLLLLQRKAPGPGRKFAALMLLQPVCAGLLYLILWPPGLPVERATMSVLTAGATRTQAAQATGAVVVSLPEAPRHPDARPVPDLATALRRHPDVARLQILGHGLDVRDREAARGRAIDFQPPPLPAGLVELYAPADAAPGAGFAVAGRVHGFAGGEVRLLDPAGQAVDSGILDEAGGFQLTGYSRGPGLAEYALQVLDADGAEAETAPVPVHVRTHDAPRVLLLAGAPNPEFRHLRRWAEDAGLDLHVEVAVGGGVGLGDGPAPASADGFGRFDLVIADERSLAGLGVARRAALAEALAAGTGVLVRTGGELSPAARRSLAELGLAVTGDGRLETLALPQLEDAAMLRARMGPGSADAPFDAALAMEPPPELARRALRPEAADAVVIPVADSDAAFAWWNSHGRGRIGLWTLTDSYRLALAGRADLHAQLWSTAAAALVRPVTEQPPHFPDDARAGRRMAICGLAEEGRVVAPDGASAQVLVDPAAGFASSGAPADGDPSPGCAAYWPLAGGWHLLETAGARWPFHVRAADDMPGVTAAGLQEATLRLAGSAPAISAKDGNRAPLRRGPSWPWFLAWLAASGLLWWLERRRRPAGSAGSVSRRGGVD